MAAASICCRACAKAPRSASSESSPSSTAWRNSSPSLEHEGLTNIRVWDGDAALLLPRLPAGGLDAIDLLYPDPWPKRRQRKRRFVSERTLSLFARALRPGGRFRFASDIDDYVGWTLARLLRSPDFDWADQRAEDWRKPYPGWVRTRYEAKAIAAGRVPSYLTALRRAS